MNARVGFFVMAALLCSSGLAYSVFLLGETLRFPDEQDYLLLARNLIALQGYTFDGESPTAYRPPGYVWLITPILLLVDSVHALRVVHFALLALAAHLLASLWRDDDDGRRWDRSSLVLATTFCYPVLYYTAGTLFPQTIIALLLTMIIVLLHRRDNSVASAVLIGALTALVVEVSPTVLVAIPVMLGFAMLSRDWSVSRVLVMMAVIALVFGGWFARNIVVMNEPIMFSSNLATNLDNAVLNLEPLASGETREPKGAIEIGLERLSQYIASPEVYLARVVDFFAYRNELQVREESTPLRDLIMFVSYHALLLAILIRLMLCRLAPLSTAERLILVLYIATALFHALVIPRIRYRLPFDFLLLLPALKGLSLLLDPVVRTRRRSGRALDNHR